MMAGARSSSDIESTQMGAKKSRGRAWDDSALIAEGLADSQGRPSRMQGRGCFKNDGDGTGKDCVGG